VDDLDQDPRHTRMQDFKGDGDEAVRIRPHAGALVSIEDLTKAAVNCDPLSETAVEPSVICAVACLSSLQVYTIRCLMQVPPEWRTSFIQS
jgi:hypothetical protein